MDFRSQINETVTSIIVYKNNLQKNGDKTENVLFKF